MSKTWKIDSEGVLSISPGFRITKGHPDFHTRRDEIKAIVAEEGVSEIGDNWFCYLNQVGSAMPRVWQKSFGSGISSFTIPRTELLTPGVSDTRLKQEQASVVESGFPMIWKKLFYKSLFI